jgi:hypothetical protein
MGIEFLFWELDRPKAVETKETEIDEALGWEREHGHITILGLRVGKKEDVAALFWDGGRLVVAHVIGRRKKMKKS